MQIDIQAIVGNGIGDKEVKFLTEQVQKSPGNVNDLKHTIENFHALLVEIFTSDSILCSELRNLLLLIKNVNVNLKDISINLLSILVLNFY